VSFDVPAAPPRDGEVLGIDRGVNNVLATSEGELIGADLDRHIDRIKRTRPKSRGRWRALTARTQYVNECLKALPFAAFAIFVIETLKGIKFGKRGKLSRRTNRRLSHWTVGHMGKRLKQLCEDNCVALVEVPPAYTSQYCPACGHVERGNRRGSVFRCRLCDYQQHADLVGARNIRDVYLGTISVPHAKA
jgi:putative transposase